MTAPTVNGTASGASAASNTNSHDITLPGSISAGERLVVFFSVDDANKTPSWIDEDYSGGGWEIVGDATNDFAVRGMVVTRVALGSGADQLRMRSRTDEQSSHISYRISAANCVDATGANGNSTNSDPPSHTITADNASPSPDVLWLASRHGDSTVVASAAPAGYSSLQTQAAAGTSGASTNVAQLAVSGDYEENPGAFTSNTEQWVAFTVAVYNANQSDARLTQLVIEVASQGVGAAPTGVRARQFVIAT